MSLYSGYMQFKIAGIRVNETFRALDSPEGIKGYLKLNIRDGKDGIYGLCVPMVIYGDSMAYDPIAMVIFENEKNSS
jgi:hypothetical protein